MIVFRIMKFYKKLLFLIITFFLLHSLKSIVLCQDHNLNEKTRVVLSLEECVKQALKNSPEIKETQWEINIAFAKQSQAASARLPQIDIIGVFGPSPRARGDQVFSPERGD